jgi:hypothetical protein
MSLNGCSARLSSNDYGEPCDEEINLVTLHA